MILLHLLEGKAFVWNAEDARKIREQHGLVGNLVGALARKPRQNARLGLPLQLLPEETRLLVEIGAATLVRSCLDEMAHSEEDDLPMDSAGSSFSPDDGGTSRPEVEAYKQHLHESYKGQWSLALQEKRRTLENLSDRIAEGRTRRKRQRGEPEEELMESSPQGQIKELQNFEETFTFPREAMMVQLPTARLPHGKVEEVDLHQVSSIWPHAGQKEHEMRYQVFRDLWQKGYFLTTGSKFGGDFLVYPGDPMRFHAHYIAICFPYNEEIPLSDIIIAGRLGTNVKKTVLLCSTNEGTVTYTSLQWSGLQ
ncbi:tRNA-splicing endonuclease subunit Sen34 isoform X1 [Ascaphus truei]|uniref:tRNA-splicing endonuclease subunit Sen34 isoform X1 n=1 Tax=Ascaphus truei TaxID=8439 RepID=UPI003F5A06A4